MANGYEGGKDRPAFRVREALKQLGPRHHVSRVLSSVRKHCSRRTGWRFIQSEADGVAGVGVAGIIGVGCHKRMCPASCELDFGTPSPGAVRNKYPRNRIGMAVGIDRHKGAVLPRSGERLRGLIGQASGTRDRDGRRRGVVNVRDGRTRIHVTSCICIQDDECPPTGNGDVRGPSAIDAYRASTDLCSIPHDRDLRPGLTKAGQRVVQGICFEASSKYPDIGRRCRIERKGEGCASSRVADGIGLTSGNRMRALCQTRWRESP